MEGRERRRERAGEEERERQGEGGEGREGALEVKRGREAERGR